MILQVGTSGYGYKEWKGKFYPEKIPADEMLRFYSGRFNTVEINNTFYRMPVESVLESWAEQVPKDFVFALKAPQVITHFKRLRNAEADTEYLFRTLAVLKKRLGPVLFQLPGSFHLDLSVLREFLGLIPGNLCAFEFRNRSWFNEATLDLLREKGCSLCIADSDEHPADRISTTVSWGYLRLRRSDYADDDLSFWLERILAQPWKKAFVFFKHEDEARGPELAMRFRRLLIEGS